MAAKKRKPDEIIGKPREVEIVLAGAGRLPRRTAAIGQIAETGWSEVMRAVAANACYRKRAADD